ncbi:hypothetical protein [Enterococcus sp. HY326]|uniref:hypothetical protein n=1 Tax=Enterococcus sp. HY326 TaxID=2971265 RepID=UPI00223F7264|nr:hypothetical protein [Enterococcus sp. HY326]
MKKSWLVMAGLFLLFGGTIVYLTFQNDDLRQEVATLESQQSAASIITVPNSSSKEITTTSSSEPSEVAEETNDSEQDTVVSEEPLNVVNEDQVRLLNEALVNTFYGTNENRLELLQSYLTAELFEEYNTLSADEVDSTESEVGDKVAYYRQVSDTEFQAVNFILMSNHGDENRIIMSVTYTLEESDWKASSFTVDLIAKVTE